MRNPVTEAPATLTLMVATDRNPLIGCAAAVRSVLDHASGVDTVDIVVLCDALTEDDRRRLEESWSYPSGRVRIRFVPIPADWTAQLIRGKSLTRMAYARLFLDTVVASSVTRLIYIDTDTVCGLDVGELLRTDLRGRTVGAVPNGNADGDEDRNVARLGLQNPRYFNSGVLLIDVVRWRERHVGRAVLDFCRMNPDRLVSPDQDGLNVVLDGDWFPLDERWNRWAVRAGPDERCILHYTMNPKPWDVDYRGPHRERFFAAVDRTAYAGWRPNRLLGLAPLWKRINRKVPYWPTVIRRARRLLAGLAGRGRV